jgi:hypothetical protein
LARYSSIGRVVDVAQRRGDGAQLVEKRGHDLPAVFTASPPTMIDAHARQKNPSPTLT